MTKKYRAQAVLLLADGFDETPVTIVATRLRQAGLSVIIVGLRAGQVSGEHGINLRPDLSLDRFLETSPPISALILPEGVGHLDRLRHDPRVNTMLQRALSQQAWVVGLGTQTSAILEALPQNGHGPVNTMLHDHELSMDEFVNTLAIRLIG